MKRFLLATVLLSLVFVVPAMANNLAGRTGVGGQIAIQKLIGGDRDYSNVDQNFGLWLRHGYSPRWSAELGADYGWIRPGSLRGEDAGFTFGSVHAFYTTMLNVFVGTRYHFAPEKRFGPYMGARLGVMSWEVRDENGRDTGFFPGGPTVYGYDNKGDSVKLEGTNMIGTLSLGAEYFLSNSFSMDIGARYTVIFDQDKDNVGSSKLWGPTEVDVNTGRWDMFLGGTLYFGSSSDKDKDGIDNKYDGCPEQPEDIDGYQDLDGCPDPDNDGDGILDADDRCPDDAEDLDGYRDQDGCPDPDNDGDGVIDAYDNCPDEAEDFDGFQDDDGCPDLDNDGDGVLDTMDKCGGTPPGVGVDLDGCPLVAEIAESKVLEGVNFAHNSADLTPSSFAVLDNVAASLAAYPEVKVEIQGHTDSSGSAAYNLDISSRRAASVKEYLVRQGIATDRLTAVGYGEDLPLANNETKAGRATNRRVELVRLR